MQLVNTDHNEKVIILYRILSNCMKIVLLALIQTVIPKSLENIFYKRKTNKQKKKLFIQCFTLSIFWEVKLEVNEYWIQLNPS